MTVVVTYKYLGMVERGTGKPGEGYSKDSPEGHGPLFPWMTKAECRADAKARGAKAEFVR